MVNIPTVEDWRVPFEATQSLAQDASLLEHVRQRFHAKYLDTIMRARNTTAADRAWEGFYFWMVFPETNRKPFEVPTAEADALLAALKPLVTRLQDGLRDQRANEGRTEAP